jgi:hypothetical protein
MPTLESAVHLFESLADGDKAKVLGRISWYLTIASRDVCTEGDLQQQHDKLVAISELQHKAISQLLSYLGKRQNRYSDRDIFLILVEMAKKSGLIEYLQYAFDKALAPFNQSSSSG